MLSSIEQEVYRRIFSCAENGSSICELSDLDVTADDIDDAYWAFDYDNPQFLELGSGYSYAYTESGGRRKLTYLEIEYGRSSVPQGSFNSAAQSVLGQARQFDNGYDQLKYVHDWIVNNTVYRHADTYYETEADGPLVYGTAVCEGYSKAFMYFAQSLGYECVCAIGRAGGVDHMWNMVKLGGQWYNVDVTWDDPVMSDGSNKLRYNYFLISDSKIQQDHWFDTPFKLPDAPSSYM